MNPSPLHSGTVPFHAPGIETIAALRDDDGRPVGQADTARAAGYPEWNGLQWRKCPL
jgi:hypothetical protein